jgi:NTE family protein
MACNSVPEPATGLKAAINYNSFMGFSVIGNLTLRNFISPSSRTMVSLNIGQNFRALTEHLQLFGYRKPWSNRTQFYAEHQNFPFYENFKQQGNFKIKYYRFDNQFLNSSHRRWSGGLGAKWEYVDINPTIQVGDYFEGKSRFFTLYTVLNYNSFEKPFFPVKGNKIDFQAGYVLGLRPELDIFQNNNFIGNIDDLGISYGNYFRIALEAKKVERFSNKLAGIFDFRTGMNMGPNQSMLNNFIVGGMTTTTRNQVLFTGLREGKILTESAISSQIGFRYNILSDAYITLNANAMYYDFIKKNNTTITPTWIAGTGVTLGYYLPIGPFEYTIMYGGNGAGWSTYLNFGFPFKSQ